jgi:hypothetical protein
MAVARSTFDNLGSDRATQPSPDDERETIMQFSFRSALLGAGLMLTGVVAGPVLANGDTPASPPASATGSSVATYYVPLEETFRAFDSRESSGKLIGDNDGCCVESNSTRFSPIGFDAESNRIVPEEAIGVSYNVSVTSTVESGFLQVRQANIGTATTVLAWVGDNQRESAGGFVLYGPDTDGGADAVEVIVGGAPGVETHFTFEVTGYLLPVN